MMLADSIEATVKSLPKPTPKRIDDVVADTVQEENFRMASSTSASSPCTISTKQGRPSASRS